MTTDAGASDFVSDAEDTSEANDLTEGSKVSSSEPETATENSDQDESLEVATGAITASSETRQRPSRGRDRGGRDDDRGHGRRRGGGGSGRRGGRKAPAFTPPEVEAIDYKDVDRLRRLVSERGRIDPRRKTGLTAKDQRKLTREIKRARFMALLPYTAAHMRVASEFRQAARAARMEAAGTTSEEVRESAVTPTEKTSDPEQIHASDAVATSDPESTENIQEEISDVSATATMIATEVSETLATNEESEESTDSLVQASEESESGTPEGSD